MQNNCKVFKSLAILSLACLAGAAPSAMAATQKIQQSQEVKMPCTLSWGPKDRNVLEAECKIFWTKGQGTSIIVSGTVIKYPSPTAMRKDLYFGILIFPDTKTALMTSMGIFELEDGPVELADNPLDLQKLKDRQYVRWTNGRHRLVLHPRPAS